MPVRRCQTATRFRQTPEGMWMPTFPSDPNGVDMNLYSLEPTSLRAPDVTTEDFF